MAGSTTSSASSSQQLGGLKRQARHAVKYRELSAAIRRLEAMQLYAGWVEASAIVEREQAALEGVVVQLAEFDPRPVRGRPPSRGRRDGAAGAAPERRGRRRGAAPPRGRACRSRARGAGGRAPPPGAHPPPCRGGRRCDAGRRAQRATRPRASTGSTVKPAPWPRLCRRGRAPRRRRRTARRRGRRAGRRRGRRRCRGNRPRRPPRRQGGAHPPQPGAGRPHPAPRHRDHRHRRPPRGAAPPRGHGRRRGSLAATLDSATAPVAEAERLTLASEAAARRKRTEEAEARSAWRDGRTPGRPAGDRDADPGQDPQCRR